jgi:hypothetical protein
VKALGRKEGRGPSGAIREGANREGVGADVNRMDRIAAWGSSCIQNTSTFPSPLLMVLLRNFTIYEINLQNMMLFLQFLNNTIF